MRVSTSVKFLLPSKYQDKRFTRTSWNGGWGGKSPGQKKGRSFQRGKKRIEIKVLNCPQLYPKKKKKKYSSNCESASVKKENYLI